MNNQLDLLDEKFTTFSVQISDWTEPAYNAAFTCAEAKSKKEIVYLFVQKKVNRLVDSSDILYIGQTKYSFQQRYQQWAAKHSTIVRNRHVLELYGPIRLSICDYRMFGDSLLSAENQLLWWYYEKHFEYPPFNYTRARKPKNLIALQELDFALTKV